MSAQNPPNPNKDPSRNSQSISGRRTGRAATTKDACAACRHLRKGCTPECQLKDFFPSSRSKEFQNVRRFFGVKNLTDLIRSVDTPLRQTAVNSMVYEANVRAVDCVGGCYRKINYLKNEYEKFAYQLGNYRKLIAHYENLENPNFKNVQNPKFGNVQVNDLNVGVQNDMNGIRNLDAEFTSGVKNGASSSSGLKKVDDETPLSGSGSPSGGGDHLRNAMAESQLMSESDNTLKENDVGPIQPPKQPQKQGENELNGAASIRSLSPSQVI